MRLLRYGWEAGEAGEAPGTTFGGVTTSGPGSVAGAVCGKVSLGNAYWQWNLAMALADDHYFRFYVTPSSMPTSLAVLFRLIDKEGEDVCSVREFGTGILQLFDHEGDQQGSTISLADVKPFLIELKVTQHVEGLGRVSMKVDNDLITDDIEILLTNVEPNRVRFGIGSAAEFSGGVLFDEIAINSSTGGEDNSWIGGPVFPGNPAALIPSGHMRRLGGSTGPTQVNNVQQRSNTDVFGLRFLLDQAQPIFRFLLGFNIEGVHYNGAGELAPAEIRAPLYGGSSRVGYAEGNGGNVLARLVGTRMDGSPDPANEIAREEFNVVDRYIECHSAFVPTSENPNQILWLQFDTAELPADRLYFVLISNIDPEPLVNWFSVNCPTVSLATGGPHRHNTLNKYAAGAVCNLDPREGCWWSVDNEVHWFTGELVGGDTAAQGIVPERVGGHIKGCYNGTDVTDEEAVRMPWYGFQAEDGTVTAIQPYYAYFEKPEGGEVAEPFTVEAPVLKCRNAPSSAVLEQLEVNSPLGVDAGVVRAKNLRTGEECETAPVLGGGLQLADVDVPLVVEAGDDIEISCTGSVYLERADDPQIVIYGLGRGSWNFSTTDHETDKAALGARPWPWFAPALPSKTRTRGGSEDATLYTLANGTLVEA